MTTELATVSAGGAAVRGSLWRDWYGLILGTGVFGFCLSNVNVLCGYVGAYHWSILGVVTAASFIYALRAARFEVAQEHWCILALAAVSLFSCIYSFFLAYSIGRLGSLVLLWLCIFGGAWTWLACQANLRKGVDLLYVIIWVLTFLSIFFLVRGDTRGDPTRIEGAMTRPTASGLFAGIALPIVILKLKRAGGLGRALALVVLVVQTYLLFFSASRAALIATAVGLPFVIGFVFPRFRAAVGFLFVSGVLMAFLGIVTLQMLPEHIVRHESLADFTGRLPLWKLGLRRFAESPVLGHGYGTARYLVSIKGDELQVPYRGLHMPGGRNAPRDYEEGRLAIFTMHSDHVERLAETGILGYGCFVLFWLFLFRRAWQALRTGAGPSTETLAALCGAGWIVFVDSFVHAALFAVGNGLTFLHWYVLVLAMASARLIQKAQVHRAKVRAVPARQTVLPANVSGCV